MIRLTILLVCVSFTLSGNCQAQSFENDLVLLGQSQKVSGPTQSKKIHGWNPLSISYQLGIKFYQKAISEQLATSCAFELTCSRFSSAIVRDQGFLKGYFLTFDRLSRCSKISVMESLPIRLTKQGKIIETPADFHFH
jgi:putative component of membrane protein insertase Oxa1/YidC/SpoIIIJ protein YidD